MSDIAERISYPEVGEGLRITVICGLCDTQVRFTFSVEAYPEEPWRIIHHGATEQACPECGDSVKLPSCTKAGHAWREVKRAGREPLIVCLVCGHRPHVRDRTSQGGASV
ncbi:hypothetical protein [Glycomyces paridis]|uniref:Uncharacterized protein n=1 Tax=Glycomyces paridis TaxID=2126555 RepID=A0A4S8PHP4_9ACTN|nr:hypothetical protein [Glycomyces paridis]THV27919.1 hypothetical protein E9998_13080 [Glycomyces paridis]